MIEISPKQYWRELNYHDGVLYCQLLEIDGNNDWRMIKNSDEWHDIMDDRKTFTKVLPNSDTIWFIDDVNGGYAEVFMDRKKYWVVPIRTL